MYGSGKGADFGGTAYEPFLAELIVDMVISVSTGRDSMTSPLAFT